MNSCPVLWLIVPCYNEQEVLPVTSALFMAKLKELITSGRIQDSSRILFINDGSTDDTWEIITSLTSQDTHFSGCTEGIRVLPERVIIRCRRCYRLHLTE